MAWKIKNGAVSLGGTKMYYAAFGSGKKNLIIFPGISDGLTTMRGKALLLANTYSVFFDEYRVFLFSRKESMPRGYSIRDMAEDQARAMEKLGIKKASFLGISQGGMIAEYVAIDHPKLVEKLVLAVTVPAANKLIRRNLKVWADLAKRKLHRELMIDIAEKSFSSGFLRSHRKYYPLFGLIGKPKNYRRLFINIEATFHFDARDKVSTISCPTLVIGGKLDKTVGVEGSYDLHEKIPDSRLYIYPDFGHSLYMEAKDFYKRVLDFLEGDPAIKT